MGFVRQIGRPVARARGSGNQLSPGKIAFEQNLGGGNLKTGGWGGRCWMARRGGRNQEQAAGRKRMVVEKQRRSLRQARWELTAVTPNRARAAGGRRLVGVVRITKSGVSRQMDSGCHCRQDVDLCLAMTPCLVQAISSW